MEQNEKWIQKLDLYGACFYIQKIIGYEQHLKEYVKEQKLNWEEAKEILNFILLMLTSPNILLEYSGSTDPPKTRSLVYLDS